MENEKYVIRFDEHSTRDKYVLRRIEGTATVDSLIRLIDIADLDANPRESKIGDVTDAIQETLENSPQLFQFKSKGLLLAAGACAPLERNRFELTFENGKIQGILDGGHNMLAIAIFIMRMAAGDKATQKIKRWHDVPEAWKTNRSSIEERKGEFSFLTPVEVVFPHDGAEGQADFEDAILDVARARNNNSELTEETKANKEGLYDAIRDSIDPSLRHLIEWKTNDGGKIKVRDLIALSWVALSRLDEEVLGKDVISGRAIYASKGECVATFNDLLSRDGISEKTVSDIRELVHPGVRSAIKLMREIPAVYDLLYQLFPEAYNSASSGFGRINCVRCYDPKKVGSKGGSHDPKYLKHVPETKFYKKPCEYDFPDGFIMPLVWALRELIANEDGILSWKTDPSKFIKLNLTESLKVFHGMISMAKYNPQIVGKTSACYELMCNDFRQRCP